MFKEIIVKRLIENKSLEPKFFNDVLIYETDDISQFALDKNIKVFASKRYKNDMPKMHTLEFGLKRIVSDSLTIIGNENNFILIGFMGGEKHLIKTVIETNLFGNIKNIKVYAQIGICLKPNESYETEEVLIRKGNDLDKEIKDFAISKAKLFNVCKKKTPAVYSTWYYYGKSISFDDCKTNLKEIENKKLPLDVFQIDDGWEEYIGNWKPNNKFSELSKICEVIKKHGLAPGIWTSPFIAAKQSEVWIEHPEWILKDKNNKPCLYEANGIYHYIFDITIKETKEYFYNLYFNLYKNGFRYFKIDFTRAPVQAKNAKYKNYEKSIFEYYREHIRNIRNAVQDSYILMCGGLYDSCIGLVDSQRTSRDVLSIWNASKKKSVHYTVKQSLYRYYMNYWWDNDADTLAIRRSSLDKNNKLSLGLLDDEEVKTVVLSKLVSGGLVSITEPLDLIDNDRLNNLNHILPIYRLESYVNLFDKDPNIVKLSTNTAKYLVLFNWSNHSINKGIKLLDFTNEIDDNSYYIVDFYSRKTYLNLDKNSIINLEPLKAHGSTILMLSKKKEESGINFEGHYLMKDE